MANAAHYMFAPKYTVKHNFRLAEWSASLFYCREVIVLLNWCYKIDNI